MAKNNYYSTIRMAQELANSPTIRMAQELANSPAIQIIQELANSPVIQMIQEWVNDNFLQEQFQPFIDSNVCDSDFISNFCNYANSISDFKNQESLTEKLELEELLFDTPSNNETISIINSSKSSIKLKKPLLSDVLSIISILITILLWYIGQPASQPTEKQAQEIIECLSVLSSQHQAIIELMEASQKSESSPADIHFGVVTPDSALIPDYKSPVLSDDSFDNSEAPLEP